MAYHGMSILRMDQIHRKEDAWGWIKPLIIAHENEEARDLKFELLIPYSNDGPLHAKLGYEKSQMVNMHLQHGSEKYCWHGIME